MCEKHNLNSHFFRLQKKKKKIQLPVRASQIFVIQGCTTRRGKKEKSARLEPSSQPSTRWRRRRRRRQTETCEATHTDTHITAAPAEARMCTRVRVCVCTCTGRSSRVCTRVCVYVWVRARAPGDRCAGSTQAPPGAERRGGGGRTGDQTAVAAVRRGPVRYH